MYAFKPCEMEPFPPVFRPLADVAKLGDLGNLELSQEMKSIGERHRRFILKKARKFSHVLLMGFQINSVIPIIESLFKDL
jgi:hypothetical protein